ncbi:MAG: hypothetical protein U0790_02580 [Isosphaeraceae bacterium]
MECSGAKHCCGTNSGALLADADFNDKRLYWSVCVPMRLGRAGTIWGTFFEQGPKTADETDPVGGAAFERGGRFLSTPSNWCRRAAR